MFLSENSGSGHSWRSVRAALGPTNTGKTHLAISRMLAYPTGCIGLPLRLLAREVYERIVAEKGVKYAGLITGEEKIIPKTARWFACTVESMPTGLAGKPFDFVAVDEAQLADDPERGHIFTDRLLKFRGKEETLILGSSRLRPILKQLGVKDTGADRQRFSPLGYLGHASLTRLPKRSAIVAFSAEQVYGLAEVLRRKKGGAAIVMGNLSPQTRNAQVEMYQAGEVDYLVATDAIGLGLNMNIDHVALAQTIKFDGQLRRELFPYELAQIAGRAGRGTKPGSFGTTGRARELEPAEIEQIECDQFAPIRSLYWRNGKLDFSSLAALLQSLGQKPPHPVLRRIRKRSDEAALADLGADRSELDPARIQKLWAICQIPDFRKNGEEPHLRLLSEIADHLLLDEGTQAAVLPEDWMATRLARLDQVKGNVDALSARLSHVRTWSYCVNRRDWMQDPLHWQGVWADLETRLSDALHEKLVDQFVDRRTGVLVRMTRSGLEPDALIAEDGVVEVEGHVLGQLRGLVFSQARGISGRENRALRQAAKLVLYPEIRKRMQELTEAADDQFSLSDSAEILWKETPVAKLGTGPSSLQPELSWIGDWAQSSELKPAPEQVQARLQKWLQDHLISLLAPLFLLQQNVDGKEMDPAARGLGFGLLEHLGALDRRSVAKEVRALTQEQRGELRHCGVRFGEFSLYFPTLLRPAPSRLLSLLRATGPKGDGKPWLAPAGLTSLAAEQAISPEALSVAGFRKCGNRLIRLDMLERIGQEIRSAKETYQGEEKGGFIPTLEMVALLGCTKPDLPGILMSLGYQRGNTTKDEAGEVDELGSSWTGKPPKTHTRNHVPARKQNQGRTKATGKKDGPRNSRSGKPNQAKPKAKKQTMIDPDSPFAVLQNLKLDKK
jgi:ATP-dependent RNA helicase SUPV3L1/SUV3